MIYTGSGFTCFGKKIDETYLIWNWPLWSDEKSYFSIFNSFFEIQITQELVFLFQFKFLSTSYPFFLTDCYSFSTSGIWNLLFQWFLTRWVDISWFILLESLFRLRSDRFILECFNYKTLINRQSKVV